MIAYRFLLSGLFLLVLAAAPAWAQAPPVANAPVPGADFLRAGGDPVPDTTAPWRYFPLHVGNAWEYYSYSTGARRRVDVLGEETHNGRHYFLWRERFYDANGNATGTWGPRPVRFDTTNAMAWMFVPVTGEDSRFPFGYTPCPLDAPFNSEIVCPLRDYEVGGGYESLLAFGGEFPGTGTDTVRTAVKTYYSYHPGHTLDYRYAADIGYVFADDGYDSEGIYYARVDGVEYGHPQYPVSSEGGALEEVARLRLEAYPNPFREHLSVVVHTAEPGQLQIELLDVLGRVVRRKEASGLSPGGQTLRLSGAGLAPGLYVVRVLMEEGRTVTKKVLKL